MGRRERLTNDCLRSVRNIEAAALQRRMLVTTTLQSAFLLLGPTGSGKTPLGDHLERMGFRGRRCVHFDFGRYLRDVAEHGLCSAALKNEDVVHVRRILETGALLENETFYIAEAIVGFFMEQKRVKDGDIIALNGLPRHLDQAGDVDKLVRVERVIVLACPPDVARERIRSDAGGDRAGRRDDSPEAIERKIERFEARTIPILDHYRAKGVQIQTVHARKDTMPEDIRRLME